MRGIEGDGNRERETGRREQGEGKAYKQHLYVGMLACRYPSMLSNLACMYVFMHTLHMVLSCNVHVYFCICPMHMVSIAAHLKNPCI